MAQSRARLKSRRVRTPAAQDDGHHRGDRVTNVEKGGGRVDGPHHRCRRDRDDTENRERHGKLHDHPLWGQAVTLPSIRVMARIPRGEGRSSSLNAPNTQSTATTHGPLGGKCSQRAHPMALGIEVLQRRWCRAVRLPAPWRPLDQRYLPGSGLFLGVGSGGPTRGRNYLRSAGSARF